MKYSILSICFFFCKSISLLADNIDGFSANSQYAYYLIDKKVYCRNLSSNALIWQKNISQDTTIVNSLFRLVSKDLKLHGHTILPILQRYKTLNITAHKKRLYISIQFRTELSDQAKTRYAILEFDSTLKLFNLYHFNLHAPFKIFTLLPYFPLNFTDDNTIALPVHLDSIIAVYTFELSKKYQKAIPGKLLTRKIQVLKWTFIDLQNNMMLEPALFSVQNSCYQYYFQFPYPYIKDINGRIFDPYKIKKSLDSINRIANYPLTKPYYSGLDFSTNGLINNTIILASLKSSDTLFLLCKNKEDMIDLIYYNLKTSEYVIKTLELQAQKSYFFLHQNYFLILDTEEEPHYFEKYLLRELLK